MQGADPTEYTLYFEDLQRKKPAVVPVKRPHYEYALNRTRYKAALGLGITDRARHVTNLGRYLIATSWETET